MISLLTVDCRYGDRLEKAWMKTTSLNGTDYGDGSIMFWGGTLVCHNGKTDLVTVIGRLNALRYCDEIFIPVVIHVLQRGRADILQQNNALCHVVRHTVFSPFTAEQHLDT